MQTITSICIVPPLKNKLAVEGTTLFKGVSETRHRFPSLAVCFRTREKPPVKPTKFSQNAKTKPETDSKLLDTSQSAKVLKHLAIYSKQ